MHNVTAITVSTNYHDVLPKVLASNHRHFRAWYIITRESDQITRDLCGAYDNVKVLFSDFNANGAVFNKGAAVRAGQSQAIQDFPDDVRLLMDSDIILPGNFLELISKHELENDCIYGALRKIYKTHEDFPDRGVLERGYKEQNLVIGFFQMYLGSRLYQDSKNCAMVDDVFSRSFKKIKYFDFAVAHLGPIASNWNGKII